MIRPCIAWQAGRGLAPNLLPCSSGMWRGEHLFLKAGGRGATRLRLLVLALIAVASLGVNMGRGQEAAQRQRPTRKPLPAPPSPSPAQITEARELLGALGYWVKLDLAGLDESLRHALVAFQKIEGRERTGRLTSEELEALRQARRPAVREQGYPHVEVDLARQVLFVVDCCGAILRTLPISSGSGEFFTEGGRTRRACTPCGRYKVYRKIKGWRRSPLGLLYYPNYIHEGVAIHGNPAVPARPASHGCIRIPMFAAEEFSRMTPVGMVVIVYDGEAPLPEEAPEQARRGVPPDPQGRQEMSR